MFHEFGTPKIMVQNETNISYIHCTERTVETRVGRRLADIAADCSAPCGPIWPKFCVVDGLVCGYG